MERLEFFVINDQLWVHDEDGKHILVEESNREIVSKLYDMVVEFYPTAYKALCEEYKRSNANVSYFQWLVVRRFYKCNFGRLDTSSADIDCGKFHFEKVDCPLRGECKLEGVVCNPKFNSDLTPMQLRVMEQVYNGSNVKEIAEKFFLSPNTVKNHIKASYFKLGIHEKSEFIRYAHENNLFNSL